MKQKYILLLYVRHIIMTMYGITEEDSTGNNLINILMAKTVTATSKQLSQKDINGVKKYVKLNNLKQYMLSEKNVTTYIECIMNCVLSSYTIVNHNDPSLLGTSLVYETGNMTLNILDMVVTLFEHICRGDI
jgi:ABC-type Zn uptake system ZnuABC Zn-binding protein ZnuA